MWPRACESCGTERGVAEVTYDAMVDGPGYVVTELLCEDCRKVSREADTLPAPPPDECGDIGF